MKVEAAGYIQVASLTLKLPNNFKLLRKGDKPPENDKPDVDEE